MTPVILQRPDGGKLGIGQLALACILPYVQDTFDKAEAGGVLLGRQIVDSSDIVVDQVTVPMPGDRRGRYYFQRGRERHQQEIDRAWRESDGTCTYLGEWHTHPEPRPQPSGVDCADWRRKLKEDMFPSDVLFFIIVGTATVRVWQGTRGQGIEDVGEFPLAGMTARV